VMPFVEFAEVNPQERTFAFEFHSVPPWNLD
jgi:hypothetical protein